MKRKKKNEVEENIFKEITVKEVEELVKTIFHIWNGSKFQEMHEYFPYFTQVNWLLSENVVRHKNAKHSSINFRYIIK